VNKYALLAVWAALMLILLVAYVHPRGTRPWILHVYMASLGVISLLAIFRAWG
jgi:hypothetical protein